jgi:hypothetical protein
VLTVEVSDRLVERRLAAGELRCPGCGGVLARWGWARERVLRAAGGGRVGLRPRRTRCRRCGVTHVLLPVSVLLRRADLAEVIGAALAARARGWGVRAIAAAAGRPVDTVRGWCRRFTGKAEQVRVFFTVLLVDVGVDPAVPAAAGSVTANAVAAIAGAAAAVAARWPAIGMVPPWQAASAASGGRLLSPSWPWPAGNTSRLLCAVAVFCQPRQVMSISDAGGPARYAERRR